VLIKSSELEDSPPAIIERSPQDTLDLRSTVQYRVEYSTVQCAVQYSVQYSTVTIEEERKRNEERFICICISICICLYAKVYIIITFSMRLFAIEWNFQCLRISQNLWGKRST
jgi:hypothetical protein